MAAENKFTLIPRKIIFFLVMFFVLWLELHLQEFLVSPIAIFTQGTDRYSYYLLHLASLYLIANLLKDQLLVVLVKLLHLTPLLYTHKILLLGFLSLYFFHFGNEDFQNSFILYFLLILDYLLYHDK